MRIPPLSTGLCGAFCCKGSDKAGCRYRWRWWCRLLGWRRRRRWWWRGERGWGLPSAPPLRRWPHWARWLRWVRTGRPSPVARCRVWALGLSGDGGGCSGLLPRASWIRRARQVWRCLRWPRRVRWRRWVRWPRRIWRSGGIDRALGEACCVQYCRVVGDATDTVCTRLLRWQSFVRGCITNLFSCLHSYSRTEYYSTGLLSL